MPYAFGQLQYKAGSAFEPFGFAGIELALYQLQSSQALELQQEGGLVEAFDRTLNIVTSSELAPLGSFAGVDAFDLMVLSSRTQIA